MDTALCLFLSHSLSLFHKHTHTARIPASCCFASLRQMCQSIQSVNKVDAQWKSLAFQSTSIVIASRVLKLEGNRSRLTDVCQLESNWTSTNNNILAPRNLQYLYVSPVWCPILFFLDQTCWIRRNAPELQSEETWSGLVAQSVSRSVRQAIGRSVDEWVSQSVRPSIKFKLTLQIFTKLV